MDQTRLLFCLVGRGGGVRRCGGNRRRVGLRLVVVDPVFAAGVHVVGAAMEGADLECVDTGSGSGGTETEDVVVGDVVGEFDERGLQVFFIFEGEVAAAGEVGDGFGGFVFQGAAC